MWNHLQSLFWLFHCLYYIFSGPSPGWIRYHTVSSFSFQAFDYSGPINQRPMLLVPWQAVDEPLSFAWELMLDMMVFKCRAFLHANP